MESQKFKFIPRFEKLTYKKPQERTPVCSEIVGQTGGDHQRWSKVSFFFYLLIGLYFTQGKHLLHIFLSSSYKFFFNWVAIVLKRRSN